MLGGADLVIEAVFEEIGVKHKAGARAVPSAHAPPRARACGSRLVWPQRAAGAPSLLGRRVGAHRSHCLPWDSGLTWAQLSDLGAVLGASMRAPSRSSRAASRRLPRPDRTQNARPAVPTRPNRHPPIRAPAPTAPTAGHWRRLQVVEMLEGILSDSAVIASNTSTLPLGSIAQHAKRPERVVGMHYFSPVEQMPLLEVCARCRRHRRPPMRPRLAAAAAAAARRVAHGVATRAALLRCPRQWRAPLSRARAVRGPCP